MERFRKLSRIALECRNLGAADRVGELMPKIELLGEMQQQKADKRLIHHIQKTPFRTA